MPIKCLSSLAEYVVHGKPLINEATIALCYVFFISSGHARQHPARTVLGHVSCYLHGELCLHRPKGMGISERAEPGVGGRSWGECCVGRGPGQLLRTSFCGATDLSSSAIPTVINPQVTALSCHSENISLCCWLLFMLFAGRRTAPRAPQTNPQVGFECREVCPTDQCPHLGEGPSPAVCMWTQ